MFTNTNGYSLGTNDEGQPLGDVLLPPWAKSPEDFVRINRMVRSSCHGIAYTFLYVVQCSFIYVQHLLLLRLAGFLSFIRK